MRYVIPFACAQAAKNTGPITRSHRYLVPPVLCLPLAIHTGKDWRLYVGLLVFYEYD